MASQWFASWFDSPHYHKLYGYRDDSEAAAFVDTLVNRGVDLAAGSIAEARRFERPGLRFARHDMRVPFGRQAFDVVFNFFTSFGYFDEPTEQGMTIEEVYGGYGLTPYNASGSPRLILVARKGPATCTPALGSRQTFANAA